MDVEEVLALPSWKIQEWLAYFKIKQERMKDFRETKAREQKNKTQKTGNLGQRKTNFS